jgi:hypothetical protein
MEAQTFHYTVGNGWTGVHEIEARSIPLAIRTIKQAFGVERLRIQIWEVRHATLKETRGTEARGRL